jgi:opacity protein-like surface antigen
MRYTITLVLAVLWLGLPTQAVLAQSNLYVFGAIGNTESDVGLGGLNRVDDDDSSYALGVGYSFTPAISLETAYQDFGSPSAQTDCPPGYACLVVPLLTQADTTALSLSLVGSLPLNDQLEIYGKLGLTSWKIKFNGISSAFDDSGKDLHYGLGLRWSIGNRWKWFGEYAHVDLDITSFSIGIRYDF